MDKELTQKQYKRACLHHELLNEIITSKLADGKVTAENLELYAEILNDAKSSKAYYERAIAEQEREEQKQ